MASSSHNRPVTAVKGGMGLEKTPANTSADPDSSFMYGTKSGLHDTHDQSKPAVAKSDMKVSGSVGDGTKFGGIVKEGVKDFMNKLGSSDTMDPAQG